MRPFTVLFTDPKPHSELEWIRQVDSSASLHLLAPSDDSNEALWALLPEADALVTRYRPITKEVIMAAPRLRLIQRYGTLFDGVDRAAAHAAGIDVALLPLIGCIAVAEHAILLILALSRNLVHAHDATVSGAYRGLGLKPIRTSEHHYNFQWMELPTMAPVYQKVLGILGLGEIGTETARRATALGMKVLYYKRHRLSPEIEAAERVTFAEKEELLREADFVLLATPHTAQTEKLIGPYELALMKPSAFLVNISKGAVIDEAALVEALQRRHIAGAGLDVFVYEPVPYDHPLLQCDNVILTPHIAGMAGGSKRQMSELLMNLTRYARTGELAHRVA